MFKFHGIHRPVTACSVLFNDFKHTSATKSLENFCSIMLFAALSKISNQLVN